MKQINKMLIGLGIAIIVALAGIYIFGLLLSPDAEPLGFDVYNKDAGNHTVTVEIFDIDNTSLFKETYDLNSTGSIISPEITAKKGEYMFRVTLDNEIEETFTAEVGSGWRRVVIFLYDKISGEKVPIYIVQAVI